MKPTLAGGKHWGSPVRFRHRRSRRPRHAARANRVAAGVAALAWVWAAAPWAGAASDSTVLPVRDRVAAVVDGQTEASCDERRHCRSRAEPYVGHSGAAGCLPGHRVGCVHVEGYTGETSIEVDLADASGLPVYGEIFVDGNGDGYFHVLADFCGSTSEPVNVSRAERAGTRPYIVWVNVSLTDPSADRQCPTGTTGTVTVTFSRSR